MFHKCGWLRTGLRLFLLLLGAGVAIAQIFTETIIGTVYDPCGEVSPGAAISITNQTTNETRTTATGANGEYVVPRLRVGTNTMIRAGLVTVVVPTALRHLTSSIKRSVTGLTRTPMQRPSSIILVTAALHPGRVPPGSQLGTYLFSRISRSGRISTLNSERKRLMFGINRSSAPRIRISEIHGSAIYQAVRLIRDKSSSPLSSTS